MNRFTRALASAAAALVLLGAAGCGGSSKTGTTSKAGTTSSTASAPAAPGASATARAPSAPSAPTAPGAAAAGTVRASSGGVTASMRAGTHSPKANAPWPVHFVATSGGRPVRATVDYEFLLAGQVVAHRSHYRFTGRFSDVVVWPTTAVGYPLTFRAVVVAAGRTLNLDYAVRVRR